MLLKGYVFHYLPFFFWFLYGPLSDFNHFVSVTKKIGSNPKILFVRLHSTQGEKIFTSGHRMRLQLKVTCVFKRK